MAPTARSNETDQPSLLITELSALFAASAELFLDFLSFRSIKPSLSIKGNGLAGEIVSVAPQADAHQDRLRRRMAKGAEAGA